MDNLPTFRIISINKLIAHEHYDDQRTTPLMARLQKSGVLRNPPIVVPMDDGDAQYSILDGANRVQALQKIGISHCITQVVSVKDAGLKLSLWNHVVWNMDQDNLLNCLRSIQKLDIISVRTKGKSVGSNVPIARTVARFRFPNKDEYAAVCDNDELITKNELLNAVVDCYMDKSSMDRTMISKVKYLRKSYPDFCGLVLMPEFSLIDVIYLSREGKLMPNGCTRFTISPRALHLNYPIEKLFSPLTLEEKNEELQQWIKGRLTTKRIRYYAESTILFDE